MKKTAVLLYPQFSEYELSVALSILMQGGKPIVTIGLNDDQVRGESGLTCITDTTIDKVNVDEIDSLLLTGCMDVFALDIDARLIDFINQVERNATVIGSISSSPYILAKAGVLKGKQFTVGLREEAIENSGVFERENYSAETVVQDGKFITAIGSSFVSFGVSFGKALGLEFSEYWYKE